MTKAVENILEYAKELNKQHVCGKGDCISVRVDKEVYITKQGVNLAELTEDDIKVITTAKGASPEEKLHLMIYTTHKDTKAICHMHPKWVEPVADCGLTVPAVLDDMTQIVGATCSTAENNIKSVLEHLEKSNSAFIKGNGCITVGRTLNEAYTCVLVLDKATHCYVASAVVKDNVIINDFEAWLMHTIYTLKYSKTNQENILNEEEGN